jgi:hypothetical protein
MSALNAVLEIEISLKRKFIVANYAANGSAKGIVNQSFLSS